MDRLEQLQKLAEAQPDDPMSHYAVGLELINREDWNAAITAFDSALKADENYSAAYYHKGRSEIRAGAHEAAGETLRKGMEVADRAGDWKTKNEMQQLLETIS